METPYLNHLTSEDYAQVYEPAEDSFLLLDALEDDLQYIRSLKPVLCLEVGSGSGIISTAVAHALAPHLFCLAVDINPAACGITQRTAAANGVAATVLDAVAGDLAGPLRLAGAIDLMLFNPPYVPTPSEELRAPTDPLVRSWAGGLHGREVLDRLLPALPALLAPGGLLYLVTSTENRVEELRARLQALGFAAHTVKERRVRGESLMVLRVSRRTGNTECDRDRL